MSEGRGVDVLCSFDVAAAWGTAVDCDIANHSFRAKAFDWDEDVTVIPDDSFNAASQRRQSGDTGLIRNTGTFTLDAKYQGLEPLLAVFFGAAAVTGSYKHTITTANSMEGVFGTLCMYDRITVHEWDSVKIIGLKFTHIAGEWMEIEVSWVARARDEPSSGTNENLSSITEQTPIDRVQFLNSTQEYQIAVQGGVLTDWEINHIIITMSRPYDTGPIAFTSSGAPYCRELHPTGRFECGVEVQLPYENTTYSTTAINAGTLYNIWHNTIMTAGVIEFGIFLPAVKWTKSTLSPADHVGQIPQTLTGVSEYATVAPAAPFAAIVQPSIQLYNAQAIAGLASA